MSTKAEQLAGIAYADVGIDISRCNGSPNCKVPCPKCGPTAKHRNKRDLSVDLEHGQWMCHNPGCEWSSGLILARRERDGQGVRVRPIFIPKTPPTPLNRVSAGIPGAIAPEPEPEQVVLPSDTLHDWAIRWLDDRGIPEANARHFGLVSTSPEKGTRVLHTPYVRNGELVIVKNRDIDTKRFWQERSSPSLYNIDHFRDNPDEDCAVVVEGEMDAIACHVAGWPNAVSLSDGAATRADSRTMQAFAEPTAVAIFERIRRIVIAVDEDAAGIVYKNALIEKFGPTKTYVVRWPEGIKDANDLLMRDGPQALSDTLSSAKPVDIPGIYDFHDDIPKLLDIYDGGYDRGASTGWPVFDDFYQVFPGTVTTVTGIPSHGKTTWLTNLLANLVFLHGYKVGLFSPEMGAHVSVLRKFTQVAANSPILPADERLPKEAIAHSALWVADRIFRVDAVRTEDDNIVALGFDELMDRFSQLVVRSGINVAVIDPWIRIEAMRPRGLSETEWIAHCMNKISRWAQRHGVAFFVVNHPRKQDTGKSGEDEGWVAPYEMMGSAYWYALSDFILGVLRDKYGPPETKDHAYVRTWKVREERVQGNLGITEFTFDPKSERFYTLGTHPVGVGVDAYTDLPEWLRPPEEQIPFGALPPSLQDMDFAPWDDVMTP